MIQGKKIDLRLIKEEDIEDINKLGNDLSARGEYLGIELASEISMKRRFAETGYWEKDFGKMLIIDKKGSIVGDIVFFKGAIGYEIGYQIYKLEDRGKGYTSEALKIFTAYVFELKPINRLQISAFEGNIASRRTAEKCGYVYEGTMRQALFARGKYHNLQLFSILREESTPLSEVMKEL